MSKVTVSKHDSGVSIHIDDAKGTLNLSREQAESFISKIQKELGLEKEKKIVKLRVPVKYLSEKVKEEDKEALKVFVETAKNISEKGYGVAVLPAVRDDSGNLLFDLEVL